MSRPLSIIKSAPADAEEGGMEQALHARLDEADQVLGWRFEMLEQAGFEPVAALALATSSDVDVHVALDLLARGCPCRTALRILL